MMGKICADLSLRVGMKGYKSHAAVCVIEAMLILLVHGRGSFIALETSHELYVLGYSYKKAFSRIVTSVNVPPIRILYVQSQVSRHYFMDRPFHLLTL